MDEINLIKQLGETIGYGHIMIIASELWKKDLINKGYPDDGAFIPVTPNMIKEEYLSINKEGESEF